MRRTMIIRFVIGLTPLVCLLFAACGGKKKDNPPLPPPVNAKCVEKEVKVTVSQHQIVPPGPHPLSKQIAVIPQTLQMFSPGGIPKGNTKSPAPEPAKKKDKDGCEHPDDLASRQALENHVRLAVQACGAAFVPFAASVVPAVLNAPVNLIPAIAASGQGPIPINPAARDRCKHELFQVEANVTTMDNGKYIQRKDVKEWLVQNLGQPLLEMVGAQAGITPAALFDPVTTGRLALFGKSLYQTQIAPLLGSQLGSIAGSTIAAISH